MILQADENRNARLLGSLMHLQHIIPRELLQVKYLIQEINLLAYLNDRSETFFCYQHSIKLNSNPRQLGPTGI